MRDWPWSKLQRDVQTGLSWNSSCILPISKEAAQTKSARRGSISKTIINKYSLSTKSSPAAAPYNWSWDLMKDPEFIPANKVFAGNLHDQKERGLDTSKSHPAISKNHLEQIYNNYLIPHFDYDPKCLQLKTYFEIAFFLGKCWETWRRPALNLVKLTMAVSSLH